MREAHGSTGRTTQLREILLGLGLTITDSQVRVLLNDKLDEYARLMHVSRRTAPTTLYRRAAHHLRQFLLAAAISDEAPGADMADFERAVLLPTSAHRTDRRRPGRSAQSRSRQPRRPRPDRRLVPPVNAGHDRRRRRRRRSPCSHAATIAAADRPLPRQHREKGPRRSEPARRRGENARAPLATTLQQDADGLRPLANTDDGTPATLWRNPNA